MADLLILTQSLTGRIAAFSALGRALEEAGHSVSIVSPLREAAGGPITPMATTARLRGAIGRLPDLRRLRRNRADQLGKLDLDGFLATLEARPPDLLLIDVELPAHIVAAAGSGWPVALLSDFMALWKRPGLPPPHTPIVPGRGWWGSAPGMELAWARYRLWKWQRLQRRRLFGSGRDQVTVLREAARRYGFSLRRDAAFYDWLIPVTFPDLPVLTLNGSEFEFPHQPPPRARYVGPLVPPPADSPAEGDDSELARAFDRAGRPGATLVYAASGAYLADEDSDFVVRVIAAAAERPEWELIIGLGGGDRTRYRDLPGNVTALGWAPQARVLAAADVAILHGGINSINEALAAGVPVVSYPHRSNDGPGIAARVEYHRVGSMGDRSRDRPAAIGGRVDRIVGDETIRRNASAMRDAYEGYRTRREAVAAVEDLLG